MPQKQIAHLYRHFSKKLKTFASKSKTLHKQYLDIITPRQGNNLYSKNTSKRYRITGPSEVLIHVRLSI
jgi:hypothetical protein